MAAPTSSPASRARAGGILACGTRCGRARHEQPEDPQAGAEPVDVTAADHRPQHQRVHRPQQVRPGPGRWIAAEQAVQRQRDHAEREREQQLQPCRDVGDRDAAHLRRRPVHRDRDGAVERGVGLPVARGLQADRVADRAQLRRRHHVRVVADQGDPAVRRVAEAVRGPAGRQQGQHDDRDDHARRQQPEVRPGTAPHRDQAAGDTDCAEHDRGVNQGDARGLGQVQGKPQRRDRPGPRDHRHNDAWPGHAHEDHQEQRDRDVGGGDPAENPGTRCRCRQPLRRSEPWRAGHRPGQAGYSTPPAPVHHAPAMCRGFPQLPLHRGLRMPKLLDDLDFPRTEKASLTRSLLAV